MMFQLFEAIAGRVRDQADDYANAQARIAARTVAQAPYPLGFALPGVALPQAFASGETKARPPQPRSEQRARRSVRAKAGRPRRRPVMNLA